MPKTSESESLIPGITDSKTTWVPIQKFWNRIPKILESESLIPRIADSIFRWDDCMIHLEYSTWIHPYGNKLFHCLQIRKKISRAWLNKIAQIVDILNWPFILRKLAFSRVEKKCACCSKGIQYTNFWAIIKLWQFAMIHVIVILWSSGKEWRYTPTFWLRISRSFA